MKVFYDGLCPLCSREIDYYKKKDQSALIKWCDITEPGFDAQAENLDPTEVHRIFHVKNTAGEIITGVEAFVEIWRTLPELKNWARASQIPGVKPAMKLGYFVFAKVRPFLPRKTRPDCADGNCKIAG